MEPALGVGVGEAPQDPHPQRDRPLGGQGPAPPHLVLEVGARDEVHRDEGVGGDPAQVEDRGHVGAPHGAGEADLALDPLQVAGHVGPEDLESEEAVDPAVPDLVEGTRLPRAEPVEDLVALQVVQGPGDLLGLDGQLVEQDVAVDRPTQPPPGIGIQVQPGGGRPGRPRAPSGSRTWTTSAVPCSGARRLRSSVGIVSVSPTGPPTASSPVSSASSPPRLRLRLRPSRRASRASMTTGAVASTRRPERLRPRGVSSGPSDVRWFTPFEVCKGRASAGRHPQVTDMTRLM